MEKEHEFRQKIAGKKAKFIIGWQKNCRDFRQRISEKHDFRQLIVEKKRDFG